jgi:multiple sugar transport system substrate-binding protein
MVAKNQARIGTIIIILLLLTGAFIVTAQEQEPVTLRFAWWGGETRHAQTIQVLEMFQEQYPWITVEYEPSSFNDHWVSMDAQRASGHLPDLIQHDYSRLQDWVNQALLLPLDAFVADGLIDLSNVAEANLEGGRLDDQFFAINLGNNSLSFILDVDAFQAAGIPLPDYDWTWTEFENACAQLHDVLDVWCMGPGLTGENIWRGLWLSYGKLPYQSDGNALGYDEDDALVNYLDMVLRLQDAGAIPNRAIEISQFNIGVVEDQPIVKNQAAMASLWSNQLVALWNAAEAERQFALRPVPRPDDGCCSSNFLKPSMFLTISATSQHPEEAALLIDFFTNSIEANKVLMGERGVPISSVVQEALVPLLSPAQQEMFEFLAQVEADSSPLPPPDPASHPIIRDTLYTPIVQDAVSLGEISPQEAVALFREEANAVLAGQ